MSRKIRLTIRERLLRDSKGRLKCCYITALSPTQKMNADEFLEKLAKRTNMNEVKLQYILEETMQCAVQQLVQGIPVDVPRFGTLRLSIKGKAKGRACDAGEKAIESISLNFLPCTQVRKMLELNNLQFKIEES